MIHIGENNQIKEIFGNNKDIKVTIVSEFEREWYETDITKYSELEIDIFRMEFGDYFDGEKEKSNET